MDITHLALLRGINVGGKVLKMEPLLTLLMESGYIAVRTYIQSGNVIFNSPKQPLQIAAEIQQIIKKHFDLDVVVIMRQLSDLGKAIRENPFSEEDRKQVYLVFTSTKIESDVAARFDQSIYPEETVVFSTDVIYLKYGTSAGTSKLNLKVLEKKLGVTGTMRNINTVEKLHQLLSV